MITEIVKSIIYEGLEKFGRYYSSYIGYVANNQDPEGRQRVQLIIPHITADQVLPTWALPKGVFIGKTHGAQVIPQKGDLVWVEFQYGDPQRPTYHLGYPTKDTIPAALRDPNIFWFKTPKGILVELDDTKEEVRVTDKHENKWVLNKKGISLQTSKGIFLGSLNKAAQPVLLGTNTVNALKLEQTKLNTLVDIVSAMTTGGVIPSIDSAVTLANTLKQSPSADFDNITSNKVKTD
jgi:hypothetical protein